MSGLFCLLRLKGMFLEVPLFLILATIIIFTLKAFVDALLRERNLFQVQQFARIAEAVSLVCILGGIFLSQNVTLSSVLSAYMLTSLIFVLVGFLLSRKGHVFSGLGKEEQVFWQGHKGAVIEYSTLLYINGLIGYAYSYGDKLFFSQYVDDFLLGQYSAYYMLSVMLFSQATILFINVFFPVIVQRSLTRNLKDRIERIFLRGVFILVIPFTLFIYFAISLLGKAYTQDIILSLLFSLLTFINVYFLLIWWQIASVGNKGVRFMIRTGILSLIIFFGVFYVLISVYQLPALIIALSLSLLYNIIQGRIFLAKNIL